MKISIYLQTIIGFFLFPAIFIKRLLWDFYNAPRREIEASIFGSLGQVLAEDPVLTLKEFNGKFFLDSRSDIFRRIVTKGYYEPILAKKVSELIDKEKDFIDVGANVGFFTIFAAQEIRGKVLAIEPTVSALNRLEKNIALNNVGSKVIVYEGVASDSEGEVTVKTIPGKEEYSSVGVMLHPSIVGEEYMQITVCANTLDNIVELNNIIPGFIKIDVEGAEHLVLKGASNILREHRPIILAELSDFLLKKNGSSSLEVISFIESFGYEVIDPLRPGIVPGVKGFGDILCIPKKSL